MLLRDKVVVVSGLGPGLGAEIARAAVRDGAHVVLAARTTGYLEKLATELSAWSDRRVTWLPTDITDVEQCSALAHHAVRELGRVDALVNNAYRLAAHVPFEQMDASHWRVQLEVNFVGTLQMTQAFVPALRESGGGAIAMISSVAARTPMQGMLDYAASKSALQAATRTLALELGPDRIRVNTLAMGWMNGPAVMEEMRIRVREKGLDYDALLEEARRRIALGEIPDDADCAGAVVFMISDHARAITGALLDVNGGEYMP
jgi:NAD(P)-dependent dehydrogenase (short-subunit alcohol dehydrogenase family)